MYEYKNKLTVKKGMNGTYLLFNFPKFVFKFRKFLMGIINGKILQLDQ